MDKRLIVALDFPTAEQALDFIQYVPADKCRLKVGFELFVSEGPDFVKNLVERGFDVFLDLKFHDIPNTVAAACLRASQLGVWMLNVHALGGENMLSAASNAVHSVEKPPLLIAVTVLTSMDRQQLSGVGIDADPAEQVLVLAEKAQQCGLDGVVCSAQEATLMREALGREFSLVTPGIRPVNSVTGDQRRIMTPGDAIQSGAHYLVIGRPITQAENPAAVIESVNLEIARAVSSVDY